ncbi:bifunctional adenosylcobinamide kinase/adenosylcobinamide-phosphate guanylyltransferase [Saliniramus sp.]|uniref:bifunctional adenosylcobinamide kinase/adenosylcobinamide-phosphate guanylyltransferase n=1 Tax=Saliniramus sp. TaxID=2986772 RepID=UPI002C27E46B|nr:bifunctional adenosylcobinamide kinase/adenosylcobinamide-phosphate guanylyltransferase [Saliniramus sp.]HMB09552.1 bifunctional adenosylcobinamide kinase/adenosylcobinamide-phosphate guanylyltransferase [Saliniramus sp.]
MSIILITGGARSGKSRHAEERVLAMRGRPVYIATAEALDDEMRRRIATHQARRDARWGDHPAPLDLVGALDATDGAGPRLVDCLTLWLTNLLFAERDLSAEGEALCAALVRQKSPVVLVTNEVGFGIVPENRLARQFRDAAGRLAQDVGAVADEVVLVVAGQPLRIK